MLSRFVNAIVLLLCAPPLLAEATVPGRPNILWIIGENLSLDLGCYGEKLVRTPVLDALAQEGVRYVNVFATSPVCAPSRSAFMTGMYQTSIDTHHMRSHRHDAFRLPAGVRPLTHRLRDAGYFTANIKTINSQTVGTGKLDLNFVNEGPIFESEDWSQLKAHQPFFAQINLPEAEYDIYDRKSSEKPRVPWVGEQAHPQFATADNVSPPPYYPDHRVTREEWARYLNSVSGMDARCRTILNQLRTDGLAENTIVVFFGDNGQLTARGIHWCWDVGLHVPLIIRWPKDYPLPAKFRPGTVDDRLLSLIDLTATTLSMANIRVPALMHGRAFVGNEVGMERQYVFSARDRIDETQIRLRSVRERRYHYIRNFTPGAGFSTLNRYKEKCFLVLPLMRRLHAANQLTGAAAELMRDFPDEMLYDTHLDPHETHNLASSDRPEHQSMLLRLRTALETWMVETNDQGAVPEGAEVVAPFEKEMHEWFGTPAWYPLREPHRN